jgi:adenylosuccinate lyase
MGAGLLDRYSLPDMARIWSLDNRLDSWLAVELAVCEGWASLGRIPENAMPAIRAARYDAERMRQIEAQTRHDMTAFLRSITERMGDEGRYIHLGLTSSDVVDTALALQVVAAVDILVRDVDALSAELATRAEQYRETVMVGRTHGVHAEPTTLGFKLAGWLDEVRRDRQRLVAAGNEMRVGKVSGAVGTHANVPPEVEEIACARLGLRPDPVSTQIVQRDRHAYFLATLAVIAGSLERFATEIRHLQRTEVREVEEPFAVGQQGSSAMPHKRNPELSERICGLARVIRGNAITALEAQALWHERDISNSSAERLIFPESCLVLDYALQLMTRILSGLQVFPARMQRNLELTHGLVYSQRVLLALIDGGVSRSEAYDVVQRCAMECWQTERDFQSLLAAEPLIQDHLSREELTSLFEVDYFLKHVGTAFDRLGLASRRDLAEVPG